MKSEPTPSQTSAPSGKWGRIVVAVAIAVVCVGAWYYTRSHNAGTGTAGEAASGAQASIEPIPVRLVHLTSGGILRTSTQIGTVRPFEDADLYAKVSGYLSTLHVDYGDRVKRDQVLAEIDDPEVVEDAKKAAADVQQARAAVTQAEAFIESAKADRDASASAVDQATAEVKRFVSMRTYHEKKYARYRDLVERKAIPQEIADEEEESYESAKASEASANQAVLHAKAQLLAAKARVRKSEADLTEAKANVEVALAKQGRADALVSYMKIHSPYDGVITKRNFFRGAFIRSAAEGGTIPLFTVARTDKVRVVTQVPDRDVPFTDVGDVAEITLDALGTQVLKGKVSRFAESEDPTSRTMHTEIDLDNSENLIRSGMYGIARIILDHSTKASTLPANCLVGESKEGKGDVFIVKDGKAKKKEVQIGVDDGLRVEILSGLSPDDEVIADTTSVVEGTPVKKAEDSKPAREKPSTQEPAGHTHAKD